MEIERKFLVEEKDLPDLSLYPSHRLEQGYLNVDPVVRIRRSDDEYYLTYKSRGLLAREEYNLPLTQEAYEHMKEKVDGILIRKTRYLIPDGGLTIELDVYDFPYKGFYTAEVEFESEEQARAYEAPAWIGRDVTGLGRFQNSALSQGVAKELLKYTQGEA